MNEVKIRGKIYGFEIEPTNEHEIVAIVYRRNKSFKLFRFFRTKRTTVELAKKWSKNESGITAKEYENLRAWCLNQLRLIKQGNRELSKSEMI